MKVRILDSSYIEDFPKEDFRSKNIRELVFSKFNSFFENYQDDILKDWEIHFIFRYNNTRSLLIYSRGASYPVEKYKEITAHIPIPNDEEVSWGVKETQYIFKKNYLDKKIKDFSSLEVKYLQFKNLEDYVIDCMCRAIRFCLENGFTVSGRQIKLLKR